MKEREKINNHVILQKKALLMNTSTSHRCRTWFFIGPLLLLCAAFGSYWIYKQHPWKSHQTLPPQQTLAPIYISSQPKNILQPKIPIKPTDSFQKELPQAEPVSLENSPPGPKKSFSHHKKNLMKKQATFVKPAPQDHHQPSSLDTPLPTPKITSLSNPSNPPPRKLTAADAIRQQMEAWKNAKRLTP